jgi:hypothetical protein
MIAKWIPDVLAILLFATTGIITLRAGYLYVQMRNLRLLILSVAMGIISLTAAGDFASMNLPNLTLHTDWFLYLGQATSYLFIFLSLLSTNKSYLRTLVAGQLVCSAAALLLLIFSPMLPDVPNMALRAVMSGSRGLFCLLIFFTYTSAFIRKETRFSFLMAAAFLLLSIGYGVLLQKYFVPLPELLDNLGDLIRMGGLVTLFLAVLWG